MKKIKKLINKFYNNDITYYPDNQSLMDSIMYSSGHFQFTVCDDFLSKNADDFIDNVTNFVKADSKLMIFIRAKVTTHTEILPESRDKLQQMIKTLDSFNKIKPIVFILPHETIFDTVTQNAKLFCYFSEPAGSKSIYTEQDLYNTICLREAVKAGVVKKQKQHQTLDSASTAS